MTTYMNRYQKLSLEKKELSVKVCGEAKNESVSEKLLGITVNLEASETTPKEDWNAEPN